MSAVKSANLCWGQRYIWLRYHQLPAHARHDTHIVRSFRAPEGVTLAMIRSAVNYLVRRHEALRTTYHVDTGAEPQQRVHPPAPLSIVTVTTERDGTATPAEVIEKLGTTEFDLSREWPIRVCVVTTAAVPKQLVLVLNHMTFDAWTVDKLERELEALGTGMASRRPATLEPILHQPLDLVRYESSAATAATKERALAYWREEIAQLPADMFSRRRTGDPAAIARSATLTSPAMLDASRRIAARYRVWPSLVHVAVYNVLMAAYTGSGTVVHLSFTGNRESSPYTDLMTCMFSPVVMRVDCHDDPPFSELLQRAAQRFQDAQERSHVPYDEIVELLSRESFRRGQVLRTGSELNFLSRAADSCRARRTLFTWNKTPSAWADYGSDTYFRIYEWQDAVVVALNALSTVMDAEAVERFLRGYEAFLLVHDDPATDLRISEAAQLVGFAPPTSPTRLLETAQGTVDLDETCAVLSGHPAVRAAQVSVEGEQDLVACVAVDGPVTAAELRTHVLGRMDDHRAVRCPDRFRIYERRPEVGRAGVPDWATLTPTAEGDGRAPAAVPATGNAEPILTRAVTEANALDDVDLSESYVVAGGRVLRIPRVMEMLRAQGWSGVSVHQLASARPLRTLAAQLTPLGPTAAETPRDTSAAEG